MFCFALFYSIMFVVRKFYIFQYSIFLDGYL